MRQAFALIDHTHLTQDGHAVKKTNTEINRQGRGIKHPNQYFEGSSSLELRTRIASLQFEGSRVLRIYHKLGDWVLVGPLHLESTYGTAIEQPLLSRDFTRELWQSALGRLALKKQQEAQVQARGLSTRDRLPGLPRIPHVHMPAVILPFKRPG